ncbi:fimbria/pilus periplasmic chaperone [Paraburkholderia bonniea]|uniref:fimbrial biogenesis chaperone n=1 Tax=Paraburkholderia bonniea TaxID=2152891 RepID=UPI001291F206|nr:fimbria/pilus periplasmic chaperone [Paraburkholderia bonniea]WJF90961.1 fimbria/pilus periplasmic chaperone [Paraburkholderia bonniea]WJF94275.1 fimbria/pilus periplasmic chaperone [Paraburkholderia bonniea]
MTIVSKLVRALALGTLIATASTAHSSIVINGTRVIYNADERETTTRLTNENSYPVLIQAWISATDKDDTPDKSSAPFVITPPVAQIDSGKGQALRIMYTGAPLPNDKESVFYLSVLEVPPRAAGAGSENLLQVALRTRIKLFYRPAGLPGSAAGAPTQLAWQLIALGANKGMALKASNPTAYYVSLGEVQFNSAGHHYDAGSGMVAPGDSKTFPLKNLAAPAAGEVTFKSIDDYGSMVTGNQTIKP